MSWNYQRSYDRIRDHLDHMGEIEVAKLTREADLEQLLSETTCREIYGAHVYVQVSNFARLASDGLYTEDDYKRLIQGVHIYERAVTRIVEELGGVLVHFQGPKLHALFYRPIDDGEQLATRAVLLQLLLKDFVKTIFNPAFPDGDDFSIAGGTDLGCAIGTMDEINGDRELLFWGTPANHAAKIIARQNDSGLPSRFMMCSQTIFKHCAFKQTMTPTRYCMYLAMTLTPCSKPMVSPGTEMRAPGTSRRIKSAFP